MSEFREKVYAVVKKIPKGRVVTYGYIANLIHLRAARAVGNALHLNKSADVPCHRVVDRNGRIAVNYAFGDAARQRKKLIAEGVKFRDNIHVDLEKCKFISKSMVGFKGFSSGVRPKMWEMTWD